MITTGMLLIRVLSFYTFRTFYFKNMIFYRLKDRNRSELMKQKLSEAIEYNPIIAAVKDMEGLEKCCGLEDVKVIFTLFGDICSIESIVKKIKDAGKIAIVHMDLIVGLSSKEVAVDFLKENTMLDGIITTKPLLIHRAKELGLIAILRYFLIDSLALSNIRTQQKTVRPDYIEVLPGVMPKIIKNICAFSKAPVIAGGLIDDRESVMAALSAGAVAVSTTTSDVWSM